MQTTVLLAAVLGRLALYVALYVGVLTIIVAAPAMKYFARHISFLSCVLIVFFTGFVVSYVFIAAWLLLKLMGVTFPSELSGISVFAGMFVIGWLLNRYVRHNYGILTKFPSLGFKVMLSTLAGSWVFVGIGYGLSLMLK